MWSEIREPVGGAAPVKQASSGRKLLERVTPQSVSGEATLTITPEQVTWLLIAPLSMIGSVAEGP